MIVVLLNEMPKTNRHRITDAKDMIRVYFRPMYLTSTINVLKNDPSSGASEELRSFSNAFMLDALLKMLIPYAAKFKPAKYWLA